MSYLLVVDDDEDLSAAASKALKKAGYEVSVEANVDGVLASMRKRCPDLLILDVMFPQNPMAGFELARTIRKEEGKLKALPILLLSDINNQSWPKFASKDIDDTWMPVTDFLEKPVTFGALCEKVAAMLEKSTAR